LRKKIGKQNREKKREKTFEKYKKMITWKYGIVTYHTFPEYSVLYYWGSTLM
jgi:uncharacterized protein YbcV (DUF1398 family)